MLWVWEPGIRSGASAAISRKRRMWKRRERKRIPEAGDGKSWGPLTEEWWEVVIDVFLGVFRSKIHRNSYPYIV